ncbi:MAG: Snf7 family protein [Candidatus Thorarchaeota archaeon]|nr:MAG: Snf7 family protein [Candidatus Thorarchaeota archaeon]
MGFLSGRKKADNERRILEVKGTMNALTLRMRRLDTRIDTEQHSAKKAISRGDREQAKAHLRLVVDLENRRGRYHQQFLTLETALLNIEEAKDQAEVLRAFTVANEALTEARSMLSPAEIQIQLDRLEESFEHISIAGDLLSESLGDTSSAETDERVERQLDAMEAEILLEKEGMLPPLGAEGEATSEEVSASEEKRVDEMLADLEREAKEEREKEAQS